MISDKRVITRSSRKGMNVGNEIVELSKSMLDILMNEGRVYVNWRSWKMRDFVNILRCQYALSSGK